MSEYEIDAISAASPDMSESEMSALKDSIAMIGQQVPILVWQGRIIDGRKRLAACDALGIEAKVTAIGDDARPGEYAKALNLLRTHYTDSQRAMFAEGVAQPDRASAARAGWIARKGESPNLENHVPSQREAATAFAVAPSSVAKARALRRAADPAVTEAVRAGHLTLHAATQISTQVPHEEQAKVVKEVVRQAKGKRNASVGSIINAAAPGIRRPPAKDVTAVRTRALRTIRGCCTALDQFMGEPLSADADVSEWRDLLRESLAILKTLNSKLGEKRERSA